MKNCGSCKWLTGGVEPQHRKQNGAMKSRYDFTMFQCSVPFDLPARVPACIDFKASERRWMAPTYGENCTFYESITR